MGPTPAEEITRVREHLLGAIIAVGSASTADLSPAQQGQRTLLLGELIRYAVAGRFPKNISVPERFGPTFVDHEGTRCAMAQLIDKTGNEGLVDRVARSANHAYLAELALDAELAQWLVEHGLSAEEAARVQPSYCVTPANECVCSRTIIDSDDVIAGVVQEDGRLLVDELVRSESGIAIGDLLDVTFGSSDFEAGERVLADYANGAQLQFAYVDAETLSMGDCQAQGPQPPETLQLDVLLDIIDGAECIQTLEALDPQWAEEECTEGEENFGGNDAGEGGGAAVEDGGSSSSCSFASLPSHESGLLLALVAGLAIARSRRARHH
jgi:hypothetical protein